MLDRKRTPAPVIFICGKGRSGNTLVGRILNERGDVALLQELHFFGGLWSPRSGVVRLRRDEATTLATELFRRARRFLKDNDIDTKALETEASMLVSNLPDDALTAPALFREVLSHETSSRGKAICCEQTPRNVFFVDKILDLFPDARVVVVVRDPRGVLAAQKERLKAMERWRHAVPAERRRWRINSHPVLVAQQWRVAVRAGERHAGDERVFVLRFEDLVERPRAVLPRLCDFLGFGFDESMLDVTHSRPYAELRGRRGLDPHEAFRWRRRLSPTEVFLCELVARRVMKRLSYEPVGARPNPVELARAAAVLPFYAFAALTLNRSYYYQLTRWLRR
ncbi:MAG: sulfotransferase [Actinomycetota bacterium]